LLKCLSFLVDDKGCLRVFKQLFKMRLRVFMYVFVCLRGCFYLIFESFKICVFSLRNGKIYIWKVFKTAMFGWLGNNKKIKEVEDRTQEGFSSVKKDIDGVIKWIKHLDGQDKQLFDFDGLKEAFEMAVGEQKNKQVFKKLPVLGKQTAVGVVEKAVQTAVQTGSFYDILRGLSGNERLVVFTLMNSDMKLSYEDLALLLGKERSTVRGQINSIKQKSEGLIEEIVEKNGKKRVYVPEEIKEKLSKYAKVRVGGGKKSQKKE